MTIVTIAQVALGLVFVVMVAWQLPWQRVNFISEDRYASFIAGLLLGIAGGALAQFGSSPRFAYAGGAVAFVGVGLLLWGLRGRKPRSN